MSRKEELREWVEALRSGDYAQGTGELVVFGPGREITGYCCLGVYCDLQLKAGKAQTINPGVFVFNEDPQQYPASAVLPLFVGEHLFGAERDSLQEGLVYLRELPETTKEKILTQLRYGVRNDGTDDASVTLTMLNDSGFTFLEIADIIEHVWLNEDDVEESAD